MKFRPPVGAIGLDRRYDARVTSMGVLYHRAVQATTQQEADVVFELCVRRCEQPGRSMDDAKQIARDYIGYFATAYCDEETRARAFRLYRTENPLDRYQRQREASAEPRTAGALQ